MTTPQPVIIFFDQDCGLCDRLTFWLITQAIRHELPFLFAPLGGKLYRQFFPQLPFSTSWESILVIPQDLSSQSPLEKSAAILYLGSYLPGPWRGLVQLIRLLPQGLADRVYDWVAKNRKKWFSHKYHCGYLPLEVRERFLSE